MYFLNKVPENTEQQSNIYKKNKCISNIKSCEQKDGHMVFQWIN